MFFKYCHLVLSDLTPSNYGSADNDLLIDDGGDDGWEAVPFTKKSISGDDTGYKHIARINIQLSAVTTRTHSQQWLWLWFLCSFSSLGLDQQEI